MIDEGTYICLDLLLAHPCQVLLAVTQTVSLSFISKSANSYFGPGLIYPSLLQWPFIFQLLSILPSSSLAHYNESILPWILRTLISHSHLHPNQDVIDAKIDRTFVVIISSVELLSLAISVKDSEASHVRPTVSVIVNEDLLYGLFP